MKTDHKNIVALKETINEKYPNISLNEKAKIQIFRSLKESIDDIQIQSVLEKINMIVMMRKNLRIKV